MKAVDSKYFDFKPYSNVYMFGTAAGQATNKVIRASEIRMQAPATPS
jgi:hypothetical protein